MSISSNQYVGSIEQIDNGLFRAFDVELRPLGIFKSARDAVDAVHDAALNPQPIMTTLCSRQSTTS